MKFFSPLNLPRAWTTSAIFTLYFGPGTLINAQAINPDTVLFTTIAIWQDLRTCLQSYFDMTYSVQYQVGCKTNAFPYRPDTLGQAVISISARASSSCQALQDISSATSISTSYYSAKGYTDIIQPTILASGSCTAAPSRTATVTAYVTQTITVRSTTAPQQIPSTSPAATTTPATTAKTTTLENSKPPDLVPTTAPPTQTGTSTPQSLFSIFGTNPIPASSTSASHDPSISSTSNESSNSSFSTAEIVGIVIGVVSIVVAIITLIVNWQTLMAHLHISPPPPSSSLSVSATRQGNQLIILGS